MTSYGPAAPANYGHPVPAVPTYRPGPGPGPGPGPAAAEVMRPAYATSAVWALGLAIGGLVLAPCLGGFVPAVVALVLSRQARTEIITAGGWLTGWRMAGWARTVALIAIVVAALVAVVLLISWFLAATAPAPDPHYPPNIS